MHGTEITAVQEHNSIGKAAAVLVTSKSKVYQLIPIGDTWCEPPRTAAAAIPISLYDGADTLRVSRWRRVPSGTSACATQNGRPFPFSSDHFWNRINKHGF